MLVFFVFVSHLCGVTVIMLLLNLKDLDSFPSLVIYNISNTTHIDVHIIKKELGIRKMCHNGDTCLPENCWFIEQALLHSWSVYLFMVRVVVFNTTFNNISVIS